MLTAFSKKKLRTLLLKMAKQEEHAEALRVILASQTDFEPYIAFKAIAQESVLDLDGCKALLQRNGLDNSNVEILFRYYATKNLLTYTDFLYLILPRYDAKLRSNLTQKPTFSVKLSYETEYAICRLIFKEIQIFLDLDAHKIDLLKDNFDIRYAFKTIDQFNSGIITDDILDLFLSKDSEKVRYRLDWNRDGVVDMEDLRRSLEPTCEQITQPQLVIQAEQVNQFPNRRARQSIEKHISRTQKPIKPLKQVNGEFLVECMRLIAELELENEHYREQLNYLQCDIKYVFSLFDVDGKGKVAPGDILDALNKLDIYPKQSQLFLWMRRYDADQDGKWDFKEFSNAFKCLKYQHVQTREIDAETLTVLKQLIKTQIENEAAIECIRQKATKCDLKQFFIHITQSQVIQYQDLSRFISQWGGLDQKGFQLLIRRFDRKQQNYITYTDFIQELHPKNIK